MMNNRITVTNEDNMELMARYPDKYFDLAIVDPPYGSDNIRGGYIKGVGSKKSLAKQKKYSKELWEQSAPSIEYFNELFRVSKNQIIFGANHFISRMPYDSSSWIVWDKDNGEVSFADVELAWTSFPKAARLFKYRWNGMLQGDMRNKEIRIHPTQKPVTLYKLILTKYAAPGDKILDTHYGSGSIGIACHDLGFELTACEKVLKYYNDSMDRLRVHQKQLQLF